MMLLSLVSTTTTIHSDDYHLEQNVQKNQIQYF